MTRLKFFIAYAILTPITYILPAYGSTLVLTSLFITGSTTIYTLMHLACYSGLVYAAAKWGPYIGKDWLWAMPTLAMLFEFLPILNTVEYVATGLLSLSLGIAMGSPTLATIGLEQKAKILRKFNSDKALLLQQKEFNKFRAKGVGGSVEEAIRLGNLAKNSKLENKKATEVIGGGEN